LKWWQKIKLLSVVMDKQLYNNYKYKVHYNYYDDGPKWKEKKFLTRKDLQQFIGDEVLNCRFMVIFIKKGGKYRDYRLLGIDRYDYE